MNYLELAQEAAMRFASSPVFWAVGGLATFLIAFAKGAIGGGAASIGVPLLSIFIDPIGAAIIIAPLVSFMDMFALRSFGPSSWSMPDLKMLLPGLIAGLGLGWATFEYVDPRYVGLLIGTISIALALHWFWKRRRKAPAGTMPVQAGLGFVAGAGSGFTTFIAHAGGPPVAMYLIARGLDKRQFVGTNTAFFTIGNILKLGPYGLLIAHRPDTAAAVLLLAPIVPLSVHLGVRMHNRLSQPAILMITNVILIIGGARLLYVSIRQLLG